ncbi:hypothetical protein K474DRAFT_1605907, partial [Panus rudis PR-1116 ss-1]
HLGAWQHYNNVPYITKDSQPTSPDVQAAIDAFLLFFKDRILSKLENVIVRQCPELAKLMRLNIQQFREHSALDLGSLFTCAVVSIGGSDCTHVDWMDDYDLLAWVISLGKFLGSTICFPQLGQKYCVRPGDVFGLASRHLAHRAELPESGRRIAVTLFTGRTLAKRTLIWAASQP